MISKEFEDTIKIIRKRLNQKNIRWILVGSTNLAIQGMNITPKDLDILVQYSDLEIIKSLFSDYNTSDIKKLKPLVAGQDAWEVKSIIKNVEVQFFSERTGEYIRRLVANKIVKLKLNALEIPCFSLEDEAETYAKTNRKNKADLIENFLRTTKDLR